MHVFGPVRVEGATRPLTDVETELVTFVATHEHPVDADIVQTALWPDRVVSPKRWWNLVSETRKALGVDSNGVFHLPPLTKGQPLRFSSGVATDLTRVEAALRRVRNEATAEAACELARALEGVSGRPFDTKRGYAVGSRQRYRVLRRSSSYRCAPKRWLRCISTTAMSTKRSTRLNRPARFPGNEILYRDLILAHDQVGNARAVDNTMRDLLETLDDGPVLGPATGNTWPLFERAVGQVPKRVSR